MMIFRKFVENVKRNPNKTAVIFKDSKITYKELFELVEREKIDLKPFSHVGLILENSIEYIKWLLLASKYKFTLIPFANKNFDIKKFDVEFVYDGELKKIKEYREKESGYIIVSTSGSTSSPKPIVLTEEIKLKRIDIARKSYNLNKNDTILVSTPLYHSLGERGVLMSLVLGATCVLLDKFDIKKFLSAIENYKVTFSFAVSNQLEAIKDEVKNYDLSSIKAMVSTSYQMNRDTKRYLLKYMPIYECYGTSEIGCVTHLTPDDINTHPDSVGKALDGVEIKIKDGEILVKSPWRFKEYYKLPQITKEAFDGEFFKTGDLGEMVDGYLYYRGRKKELIKTGGISVYPMDIEKEIKKIDKVKEVAVIGVEDEYFGEVVVAVVVGDVSRMEVFRACESLAPYQRPMYIDIVASLPKTSLGKIQKFKLKEKYKNLNIGKRIKGLK